MPEPTGFNVRLGIPPSGAGTDVTSYIVADNAGISISRGAGAEGDILVGQCELVLDNSTGVFSPGGDLEIREGVTVFVVTDVSAISVFFGEVVNYSYQWPASEGANSPKNNIRVQAEEFSHRLAEAHPFLGHFEQGLGPILVNTNVGVDVPVEAVLRSAGIPLALITLEGSTSNYRTLQTWSPANAGSAQDALRELVESERRGWVFSDRAGDIHFAYAGWIASLTLADTIDDALGPVNATLEIDEIQGFRGVEVEVAYHALNPEWQQTRLYQLGQNRFTEPPTSPLVPNGEAFEAVAETEFPYARAIFPQTTASKTPSSTVRWASAVDDFSGGSATPGWTSIQLMQNFEANGILYAITLQIAVVGEPEDGIALEIFAANEDTNSAIPDKTRFITGMILDAGEFPKYEGTADRIPWTRFDLPRPPHMGAHTTSNNRYAFTLRRTGPSDSSNYFVVGISGTAGYGRMAYADYPGTGPWTTISANMGIALSVFPEVRMNEQQDGLGNFVSGGDIDHDLDTLGGNLLGVRVVNNSGADAYLTDYGVWGEALRPAGSRTYEAQPPDGLGLNGKTRKVTVPWGESADALSYAYHLRGEYELDRSALTVTIPWRDSAAADRLAALDLYDAVDYDTSADPVLAGRYVIVGIDHEGSVGQFSATTLRLRPIYFFRDPGDENTSSIAFDSFNRENTTDMSSEQTEDGRAWLGDTTGWAIQGEALEPDSDADPLYVSVAENLIAAVTVDFAGTGFTCDGGLIYRHDVSVNQFWFALVLEDGDGNAEFRFGFYNDGGITIELTVDLTAKGIEGPFRIVVAASGGDHWFWVNRRYMGKHSATANSTEPNVGVAWNVTTSSSSVGALDDFFAERIAEAT